MLSTLLLATALSAPALADDDPILSDPDGYDADALYEVDGPTDEAGGGGSRLDLSVPPRVRLGIWHAMNGTAWLAAPVEALFWEPGLTWTMALLGGGAGAASGLLLYPEEGLDHGRASAIITTEQLLMFNLATVGTLPSEWGEPVPFLLGAGFAGGVALGVTKTTFPEADSDRMAWGRSGMFAGLGVGALALSSTYYWQGVDYRVVLGALLIPTDLGFLAGMALQPKTGWTRGQARGMNLGAVVGGLAAFTFPVATQSRIIWDPAWVGGVVGLGVIGGGFGGFTLATRLGPRGQDRVVLNGPSPGLGFEDDGSPRMELSLVSGVF